MRERQAWGCPLSSTLNGQSQGCGATWVGGGQSPRGSRGAGGAVGEGDEQEQSMRFGYGDAITRPINYCVY